MARIGIAGAGLLGRLIAWRLAVAGHAVEVFDPADGPAPRFDGQGAAGFTAAGMLSPLAELDNAGATVATLGLRSLALWPRIAQRLAAEPAVQALPDGVPQVRVQGSLMLAHRSDLGAAQRVLARVAEGRTIGLGAPQPLDTAALTALEPALHGIAHAWLLPGEGQVDTPVMLQALAAAATAAGVRWHWGTTVTQATPGQLLLADGSTQRCDTVIDVRGVGARQAGPLASADPRPHLRGVRGETVWLHAPGLGLQRPVRLLHPRHRVYIVPRAGDRVVIGASEIESEDRSEVSLKTAVELMTAAHSVLPALAEARILRLDRNLRPALPDHEPRTVIDHGLLCINGLFRHGWLLAPALVDDALAAADLAAPLA
ncbi:MAG: hypothetical protein RIQ53_1583 [Pseudomonadota bacterium]|jgi:glycine oxidase